MEHRFFALPGEGADERNLSDGEHAADAEGNRRLAR